MRTYIKIFCMCLNFCNLFPELYMDSQLPTERTIVCEDAIHNSYAFVQLILVFTISFFTLFLFEKTGLTLIFLKKIQTLIFYTTLWTLFQTHWQFDVWRVIKILAKWSSIAQKNLLPEKEIKKTKRKTLNYFLVSHMFFSVIEQW